MKNEQSSLAAIIRDYLSHPVPLDTPLQVPTYCTDTHTVEETSTERLLIC